MSQDKKIGSPDLLFAEYVAGLESFSSSGGVLFKWVATHWQPLQDNEAERMAWEWMVGNTPERASAKAAAGCVSAAVLQVKPLPQPARNPDKVVIPCLNGHLTLTNSGKTGGTDGGQLWERHLVESSRADGLTYVLDCSYSPGAEAQEFKQFVEQVLPDETVREYVREYLGYTLLPDCRFQRAQFWLGSGANGKSTLAEIIAALHKKVAAMELNALDGFKLVNLLGASLAYVDETPSRIDEQRLKMLISSGLVQVDRKFRDPINLRPTAKWIILGNQLPAISDQSSGFWRRLAIVPFSATFPDGQADPLLAQRIIGNELAGVLNWALAGLHRLLERGRFPAMPAALLEQLDAGKRETNSVLSWFVNCDVEIDDKASTPKDVVYTSYSSWCKANGAAAVSAEKFWRRLASISGTTFPERKAVFDGKRLRVVPVLIPDAAATSKYSLASEGF